MKENLELMRADSIRTMVRKKAKDPVISYAIFKLKSLVCWCSLIPLVFAAFLCFFYWGLMDIAKGFNEEKTPAEWTSEITFFDACGGITDGISTEPIDTKWSTILALNSYFYLIHGVYTILLCCSIID